MSANPYNIKQKTDWVEQFDSFGEQFILIFGSAATNSQVILGSLTPFILVWSALYKTIFAEVVSHGMTRMVVSGFSALVIESMAISIMTLGVQVKAYNATVEPKEKIAYHQDLYKISYLSIVAIISVIAHVLPHMTWLGVDKWIIYWSIPFLVGLAYVGYETFGVSFLMRTKFREAKRLQLQEEEAAAEKRRVEEQERRTSLEERKFQAELARQEREAELQKLELQARLRSQEAERIKAEASKARAEARKVKAESGASRRKTKEKKVDWSTFDAIDKSMAAGHTPPGVTVATQERFDKARLVLGDGAFDKKAWMELNEVGSTQAVKDLRALYANGIVSYDPSNYTYQIIIKKGE